MQRFMSKLRPGAADDVFKAVDRLDNGLIGTPSGVGGKIAAKFGALPTGGKVAVIGGAALALAGIGYFGMKKLGASGE